MSQLNCSACNAQLTRQCVWGEEAEYDSKCDMGAPAVPLGRLIRLKEADTVTVHGPYDQVGTKTYSPAGAIAIHPEDILVGVLHSSGQDNGCCGSDGCDGPNRSCACGAVVATEWSDCWTQAEVRFLPDAVKVLDQ